MQSIKILAVLAASTLFCLSLSAKPPTPEELNDIARDAYIYAYPLVLMQTTRDVSTNVERPVGSRAPVNQFAHARHFPDSKFTDVVRPNADTLYSSLHYDVSKEPLVISVMDSNNKYYLLPLLDLWTDVYASPGTRTTGNEAQTFAIVGPHWKGTLPKGMTEYRSPTAYGMIIGRTQTNGSADYETVRKFQDGIKAYPLSSHGKRFTAPQGKVNPNQDMGAPPQIVDKMNAEAFFTKFANALKENPPHANDYPILDRMKKIGISPGQNFSFRSLSPEIRQALNGAPEEGAKLIKQSMLKSGTSSNGWRMYLTSMGTYGTDYLHRSGIAFAGLGANVVEDAIYPTAFTDGDGQPMQSDKTYVLHFDKNQIPPAKAFWSLTMYDDRQLFTENSLNRFAIGDRDKLRYNSDGSLDLYIQRDSPGKDKESNWLPTPRTGTFTMNLRLYWPKQAVLDRSWSPPPVKLVGTARSLSQK